MGVGGRSDTADAATSPLSSSGAVAGEAGDDDVEDGDDAVEDGF